MIYKILLYLKNNNDNTTKNVYYNFLIKETIYKLYTNQNLSSDTNVLYIIYLRKNKKQKNLKTSFQKQQFNYQ